MSKLVKLQQDFMSKMRIN